jgi:proteasome lid subunit RPN8/RPN11
MTLQVPISIMEEILRHGEDSYPEEGAGVLLGHVRGDDRQVSLARPVENTFIKGERARRYLIDPEALFQAELEAEKHGLEVIGIFHSHPDHPAEPSEFDRNWALPWFSYLISSIHNGKIDASRSWRLNEDRGHFHEESLIISEPQAEKEHE